MCKDGVAKYIFLKSDAADVLAGIKCDLVKALCALTLGRKTHGHGISSVTKGRGGKKSPDTGGDQRRGNHRVGIDNDDTI